MEEGLRPAAGLPVAGVAGLSARGGRLGSCADRGRGGCGCAGAEGPGGVRFEGAGAGGRAFAAGGRQPLPGFLQPPDRRGTGRGLSPGAALFFWRAGGAQPDARDAALVRRLPLLPEGTLLYLRVRLRGLHRPLPENCRETAAALPVGAVRGPAGLRGPGNPGGRPGLPRAGGPAATGRPAGAAQEERLSHRAVRRHPAGLWLYRKKPARGAGALPGLPAHRSQRGKPLLLRPV